VSATARAPVGLAPDLPTPPRLLFVTGEYPPMRGGVGDYTHILSRTMAELGASCSVITSRAARLGGPPAPLDPEVRPTMPSWGWRDLPLLLRAVDDVRPDVLHVQYQTGAFGMGLAPNLLFPVLSRRPSRPLLAVTFHDVKEPYLFPKAGPARRWANLAVRGWADLVYVTNGHDLAAVDGPARVLPIGSNITRVPLAPEAPREARARLGLGDTDFALGFFGFVDEWKGVDALVDAAEQLWADGRPLTLVFVGGARAGGEPSWPPYERAVRARLEQSTGRGRVVWTGFADPVETSARLQALDAIALPFVEGACYRHGSLMAAIEHGLPIVTTQPDARERALEAHGIAPLADGENALLVPTRDSAALASAVGRLIDYGALRAAIGAGALRLAPQFGWERIARTSLAAYDELRAARR